MKRQLLYVCLFLAFLLAAVMGTSCNKTDFEESNAVIAYYGDFDQGGCGWVIEIDLKAYQGRNLPDAFKSDQLPVKITYRILENLPDCLNRTDVDGMIYLHKVEPI